MILENFRPGVMDKLGLGYEELKIKPWSHLLLLYGLLWFQWTQGEKAGAGSSHTGNERTGGIGRTGRSSSHVPTGTALVDQHGAILGSPGALPLPVVTVIRPGRDTALRQACWGQRWIFRLNLLDII